MKLKKNLLLWNYWANLNQTLLKCSLGGPLPNLCLAFQTLWEIPIEIFLFETICSIRIKCWWNSHWMVLFQKYVRQFDPSTKMAPTAELSLTWEPMGNSHKNLRIIWSSRPRYWYYQYCNIYNTSITSLIIFTILVLPVL